MIKVNVFRFQETQRLLAEPVPGISATPSEQNARYFKVSIEGPSQVGKFTLPFSLLLNNLITLLYEA